MRALQGFGLRLGGWDGSTGGASYALVNILGSFDREKRTSASNGGRYSYPAREALLRAAVAPAMDDVAIIPLFPLVNSWALRRGLTHAARMDKRTVAMGVRAE